MMSGAKAPDFDACGLFRATHSHNPTRYEQAHVRPFDPGIITYFCTSKMYLRYFCSTVRSSMPRMPQEITSPMPTVSMK